MTYKEAIEKKDGQLVMHLFDINLNAFSERAELILKEYEKTPDYDSKTKNHLRHEFSKNWFSFVDDGVPFELQLEYRNGDDSLNLSDIMKGGIVDGYDEKLNKDIYTAIIEYSVYIMKQNPQLFYLQILTWQVLKLVAKKIDVSTMTVNPTDIIKCCQKMYAQSLRADLTKPKVDFHLGRKFERKLTSSEKAGLYREQKLGEVLEDYCYAFKREYNRYPLRVEIRKHLQDYCKESNDKLLHIFRKDNGLSDKTLTKLMKGFVATRKSKKKKIKIMEKAKTKTEKMTLKELYEHLTTEEKKIFKEMINGKE